MTHHDRQASELKKTNGLAETGVAVFGAIAGPALMRFRNMLIGLADQ